MSASESTLDEFLEQVRRELKEFEDKWRAENKKNPTHWPLKMGLPEWYEQLTVHLQR